MEQKYTNRGFSYIEFKDRNNKSANIMKSSIATEECIWLGLMDYEAKIFKPSSDGAWRKINLEDEIPNIHIFHRMELNQEQVKALLPILENFVKTGEVSL